MSNCAAIYHALCQKGTVRLFHLRDADGIEATCELVFADETWRLSQLSTVRNLQIQDGPILAVANRLGPLYTSAWEDTPDKERHMLCNYLVEERAQAD